MTDSSWQTWIDYGLWFAAMIGWSLLTLVVLLFMWSWNEFLLPLVMVTDESLRTAPLGLAFFAGQHTTDRVGMAAAAVIVAAPVILMFVVFQRSFIRGMAAGAVKE